MEGQPLGTFIARFVSFTWVTGLICAAIIYVMWKNVGIGDPLSHRSGSHNSGVAVRRSRHHYSVDCAKSNKVSAPSTNEIKLDAIERAENLA